jgi:hypothetical protein
MLYAMQKIMSRQTGKLTTEVVQLFAQPAERLTDSLNKIMHWMEPATSQITFVEAS